MTDRNIPSPDRNDVHANKIEERAARHLRNDLTGRLALPGERGYELGRPWNLAITTRPAAVVVAADVEDISTTVRWATREGLRVAVHATGHGTVESGDDVVVIHTGSLRNCTVDAEHRLASVAAGVRADDLVATAHAAGLTPIIGSNGGVGVVGYLSGGGIGPLVSTYGLSADHVRAVEVVTGDGLRYRAAANENADLFWAVRGGRSTVGIVAGVELDLMRLPALCGGVVRFGSADTEDVAHEWARWSATLPEIATTSLALTSMPGAGDPARPTGVVRFATPAGVAVANDMAEPIRRVATPVLDTIGPTSYGGLTKSFDEPQEPLAMQQDHVLLDALPAAAMSAILGHATPPVAGPSTVEVRRLGGRLRRKPLHDSAFCSREAAYLVNVIVGSTDDTATEARAHVRALLAALAPWASGARLANFAGTTDEHDVSTAFDDATWQRLSAIARRHDPAGTFAVGV